MSVLHVDFQGLPAQSASIVNARSRLKPLKACLASRVRSEQTATTGSFGRRKPFTMQTIQPAGARPLISISRILCTKLNVYWHANF